MARLVVETGSLQGQSFPIDPGLTIGREKHNDIAMPTNRKASREHCKVWREASQRYAVADFGSTNGTMVNDERTVRTTLKDGDRIRIGDATFRFELEEADRPPKKAAPEIGTAPETGTAPKTGTRPDLAAVLRGEAPLQRAPKGTGAAEGAAIEVKQRLLQYHKKRGGGSVLGSDVGQMAGLGKWILVLVAIGAAVGLFFVARNLAVGSRQAQDTPPVETPDAP